MGEGHYPGRTVPTDERLRRAVGFSDGFSTALEEFPVEKENISMNKTGEMPIEDVEIKLTENGVPEIINEGSSPITIWYQLPAPHSLNWLRTNKYIELIGREVTGGNQRRVVSKEPPYLKIEINHNSTLDKALSHYCGHLKQGNLIFDSDKYKAELLESLKETGIRRTTTSTGVSTGRGIISAILKPGSFIAVINPNYKAATIYHKNE